MADALASWNDTRTKAAITAFVERVTSGPQAVPVEERIAVFDNDGTLWTEKPMPIELGFVLQRMAVMAEQDASLRDRQPWKAAHEQDYAWLGRAIARHYAGDDADVKVLLGGVVQAFAGQTVDDYGSAAEAFIRRGRHPTLDRTFRDCAYQPMVELLRFLEDRGFTSYIASGGDRDFMRTITGEIYGIPPERVVGSSNALRFEDGVDGAHGSIVYLAEPDVFDDGPTKPVRIWSRIGRRPILAAGNSNGDVPMLSYAAHASRPSLSVLIDHDDGDREFAYRSGAERSIEEAGRRGWTVVSMKADWATVFAPPGG